jgi:protein involved in polysaccharide export with SLBB domain
MPRTGVVHVGGQVQRPGPLQLQTKLTLYQAIQAAGGATPFGSLKRVKLYRAGACTTFDLTTANGMSVAALPNDTLEVPQKMILGR